MPHFSVRSRERLLTCHSKWIHVLSEVIRHFDFAVLCGHRTEAEQNAAHAEGRSQLQWPNSKHNTYPSLAVDIAPWPIDWTDEKRFALLAGAVIYAAAERGIVVRWGGDWDRDTRTTDNRFNDLPHFEIVSDPDAL